MRTRRHSTDAKRRRTAASRLPSFQRLIKSKDSSQSFRAVRARGNKPASCAFWGVELAVLPSLRPAKLLIGNRVLITAIVWLGRAKIGPTALVLTCWQGMPTALVLTCWQGIEVFRLRRAFHATKSGNKTQAWPRAPLRGQWKGRQRACGGYYTRVERTSPLTSLPRPYGR